jgi:hypothetical protein
VDSSRRWTAAVLAGLLSLVPLGAALTIAGILEARWWNSDSTARLFHSFDLAASRLGVPRPLILRGPSGAGELIITGVLLMGLAALAYLIRRGSRAAVTSTIWLGAALLVYLVVQIGGDIAYPSDIGGYLAKLPIADAVPDVTVGAIQPLLPPAWYSWLEDIAQAASAAVLVGLVIAAARLHIPMSQPMAVVRTEPTDAYGQALRRFADGHRID